MGDRNEDLKARLLATFRVEAEEHLQALTTHLLALDRGLPSGEARAAIETAFREMHTFKGAARSVGLTEVEILCQACEAILSKLSRGQLALTPPILKLLHDGVAHIPLLLGGDPPSTSVSELIARLKDIIAVPLAAVKPMDPPAPQVAAPVLPEERVPATNTIRLDATKLDAMMLHAEDLLFPKLATGERVLEARTLLDTVTGCRVALARARAVRRSQPMTSPGSPEADPESVLQKLEVQITAMLEHIIRDHRTMTSITDGLQEHLRWLRMTPAAAVLNPFPGMVRSLAEALEKQVEWEVRGVDLEVDRKVLDAMKDPLIHLVRNAIDHGIESPALRVTQGKPPRGRVAVTIRSLEGNRIEIQVEDDGRGIDLAQVRAAAVRIRHLTVDESEALTDEAALDLIYRSGVSTTPLINDISGYGLGLAIVRERVEQLDGRIRVDSRPGIGTTVRITIPVSISTFRGLLVRAGGLPYLLPSEAVERAIRFPLEGTEGRPVIQWEGRPLQLVRLADLLVFSRGQTGAGSESKRHLVIMKVQDQRLGLVVEEIVGEQEVVLKELRPPLVRIKNVAGAGLIGTGQVILILRPADLLRSARESHQAPWSSPLPEKPSRPPVILVVDDSITTRTMEKNLLETAGYKVLVAVDGVDAWTLINNETIDLILSDVDMPRMGGLELTAKVRAHRNIAHLPIILVTALESREDKERGLEVGANAYIVKSSFDQSNLLEFIRRLL